MTDTTDIKALREASEIGESSDYMTWPKVDPAKLKRVLDQLEAERQRAADSEEELHKALHREKAAERKLLAAREEIAELKGEQVPVAWTDAEELRGMGKNGCGYLFKVDPANPFTDPRRQIMLYDRPQKPVGLRQVGSIDHDGGEFAEYFVEFTDSAQVGQAVYVIDSAIEAAGGIVKDGE